MRVTALLGLILAVVFAPAAPAAAQFPQNPPAPYQSPTAPFTAPPPPMIVSPPLLPATAMEAFRAPTGAIVTMGYNELGNVGGVFVEAREMRDSQGHGARGLVVQIARQNASEIAFVDADEIAGVLKGIDALLAVGANPTGFDSFDMRFSTKGELVVTASSSTRGTIVYGVEVGRVSKARRGSLTSGELLQLRNFFADGGQKLASLRDR